MTPAILIQLVKPCTLVVIMNVPITSLNMELCLVI